MALKLLPASGFLIFLITTNSAHARVARPFDRPVGLFVEKPASHIQVSIPTSKLLEGGIPNGLVLFNVGIDSSRLAVLSHDILKIYRPEGSVLVEEFSLSKTEAEEWGELEVFPSPSSLAGVVLYKAEDYSRSGAKVICWVKGQWQTVFEGSDVDFVDIDLDGIPEIFTEEREHENGPPDWVHVWVWDGSRYVELQRVRFQQLYATDLIQRIKAVRKQKH